MIERFYIEAIPPAQRDRPFSDEESVIRWAGRIIEGDEVEGIPKPLPSFSVRRKYLGPRLTITVTATKQFFDEVAIWWKKEIKGDRLT